MAVKRYETLDAMRGVAAFGVLIFHLGTNRLQDDAAPRGYLAVDFFFILSGFVVAYAYEAPLQAGLPWGRFFIKRSIRLFPLALLGLGMGLVVLLLKWLTYPAKVDSLPYILSAAVLNSFLLPILSRGHLSQSELFPTNSPLWTLSLELAANLVWAWIGIRLRTRTLVIFVCLSWLGLVAAVAQFHTANLGFDLMTAWGGITRVCFGFTVGVVLYRLLPFITVPSVRFGPLLLYAALLLVMFLPLESDPNGTQWSDIAIVTLVMPAIVVLGIGQHSSGRVTMWVGMLSYPVYVLHLPIQMVASGLRQTILSHVSPLLISSLTVVATLIFSAAASRVYDEPVRRWLTRRISLGARELPLQRPAYQRLKDQPSE